MITCQRITKSASSSCSYFVRRNPVIMLNTRRIIIPSSRPAHHTLISPGLPHYLHKPHRHAFLTTLDCGLCLSNYPPGIHHRTRPYRICSTLLHLRHILLRPSHRTHLGNLKFPLKQWLLHHRRISRPESSTITNARPLTQSIDTQLTPHHPLLYAAQISPTQPANS